MHEREHAQYQSDHDRDRGARCELPRRGGTGSARCLRPQPERGGHPSMAIRLDLQDVLWTQSGHSMSGYSGPRMRNHRISSCHAADKRRRAMVVERPILAAIAAAC
jgi:hypothetical protein